MSNSIQYPVTPTAAASEQTIMGVPDDEIDDATVVGRRHSFPPRTPAAIVAEPPVLASSSEEGDHDGFTVMSGDLQKMRKQQQQQDAAVAGSAPALAKPPVAVPLAQPRAMLQLPSGEIIGLDQPVLIGRAPSVTKVSGGAVPRIVSLGGVDQDISRNHVQVTVEGDTVVVTDLHSRNGTLIVLPGKSPQKLRSGEPTAVIVGTLIDLGSGIGITVGEA